MNGVSKKIRRSRMVDVHLLVAVVVVQSKIDRVKIAQAVKEDTRRGQVD